MKPNYKTKHTYFGYFDCILISFRQNYQTKQNKNIAKIHSKPETDHAKCSKSHKQQQIRISTTNIYIITYSMVFIGFVF